MYVLIHDDSYEWSSGNIYNGTSLASRSEAVVVTINFRVGILGFLKLGLGPNVLGNLGLFDILAALLWVNKNAVFFGGDPDAVTVIAHGTGAAMASLLMISPVTQKGLCIS